MSLLLFIVVIVSSVIAVRIGAIAFEVTGLVPSLAQFQAISCFTGTGFTTHEAELIACNPQRRRIASVLMVLGNAGQITIIATLAQSLQTKTLATDFLTPHFQWLIAEELIPVINLALMIFAALTVYRVLTQQQIARWLTELLRRHIVRHEIIKPVSFEELLIATGGYGVSGIEISSSSPIRDKTLKETALRARDITVLAIERGEGIIPNPGAEVAIQSGDRLICFGKLATIRQELAAEESASR
jgi:Trk-type K+ transport system membrane component